MQLNAPVKLDTATDERLLASLDSQSLPARRGDADAVQGRMQRALELSSRRPRISDAVIAITCLAALLAATSARAVQRYVAVPLGTLGGTYSAGYAVNARGDAVPRHGQDGQEGEQGQVLFHRGAPCERDGNVPSADGVCSIPELPREKGTCPCRVW